MDAGIIEDSKGEHNHPPNPQKLLAQLEEVTTIETVVNCMGTQLMKPQHLVTKVVVFLKSIFNHLFNLSITQGPSVKLCGSYQFLKTFTYKPFNSVTKINVYVQL